MISTPLPHSIIGSDYSEFFNTFMISMNKEILETLRSNEKKCNFSKKAYICEYCNVIPTKEFIENFNIENEKHICKICQAKFRLEKNNQKFICYYEDVGLELSYLSFETNKQKKKDPILFLFCIDYSGSMSMTYLKPENNKKFTEDYVQRNTIILINIENKLKEISKKYSKNEYQVFFMTFSDTIDLYGDGSSEPVILKPSNINFDDIEECRLAGERNSSELIENNKDPKPLFEKLREKNLNGQTSLGPAIAVGLGVIANIKPNISEFIIFTDGLSNIGFGQFENLTSINEIESCKQTYRALGRIGDNLKTIFNVFGFEDEPSGFSYLKILTDKTKFGVLEPIKIIPVKNNDTSTFDQEEFEKSLSNCFDNVDKIFGIRPCLSIFHSDDVDFSICKTDNFQNKIEFDGKKLKKNLNFLFGNFEFCFKYILKKQTTIVFQVQLEFYDPKTNEKIIIVENKKIENRGNYEFIFRDIDFSVCKAVAKKDEIQFEYKILFKFLAFLYEIKFFYRNKENSENNLSNSQKELKINNLKAIKWFKEYLKNQNIDNKTFLFKAKQQIINYINKKSENKFIELSPLEENKYEENKYEGPTVSLKKNFNIKDQELLKDKEAVKKHKLEKKAAEEADVTIRITKKMTKKKHQKNNDDNMSD